MMVRCLWGWSGWSAIFHRGCFIKLVSGINEPRQKPPWHDVHETCWEAYQHARCISVGVLIVSSSEKSVFVFVMCNVKSQWTRRLNGADRALWQRRNQWRRAILNETLALDGRIPWFYIDDVQLWTVALFCSEYLQPGYLNKYSRHQFPGWNWGRRDISATAIALTDKVFQHVGFRSWLLPYSAEEDYFLIHHYMSKQASAKNPTFKIRKNLVTLLYCKMLQGKPYLTLWIY